MQRWHRCTMATMATMAPYTPFNHEGGKTDPAWLTGRNIEHSCKAHACKSPHSCSTATHVKRTRKKYMQEAPAEGDRHRLTTHRGQQAASRGAPVQHPHMTTAQQCTNKKTKKQTITGCQHTHHSWQSTPGDATHSNRTPAIHSRPVRLPGLLVGKNTQLTSR